MLQTLFGLVTDTSEVGLINNALRTIFALFDRIVYSLINLSYSVIFTIADNQIISSEIVTDLFSRIQLILGLIMIFKITITLIQAVVNPDVLTDNKNGFSQIIVRTIIMLLLLISIVPLNIPDSQIKSDTSYNAYLKSNGVLFGTLYSLQHRLLSDNVIGKLVLGVGDDKAGRFDGINDEEKIESSMSVSTEDKTVTISSHLLKSFIKPNLKQGAKGVIEEYNVDDNFICARDSKVKQSASIKDGLIVGGTTVALAYGGGSILGSVFAGAATGAVSGTVFPVFGNIIGAIAGGFVGLAAGSGVVELLNWSSSEVVDFYYQIWAISSDIDSISSLVGVSCKNGYAFTYFPIVSTIVGIMLLFFLISFAIDIAIRAIKLVILRIIAPMAIISYIDPKSSSGGAFSSWVKMLTSTFMDMFIRLAIMYFCVFFVIEIVSGKIQLNLGDGPVAVFSFVAIVIGIFYFAKNIPKFVKDALGIKGEKGGGFFSGIGKIMGVGAAVGGAIGSGVVGAQAARENGRNRGWGFVSGLSGGLMAGGRAAFNADKDQFGAVRSAQNKYNTRTASGSTFRGRTSDTLSSMFGGRTRLDRLDDKIQANKDFSSYFDNMMSEIDGIGKYDVDFSYVDRNGITQSGRGSVKDLKETWERLKASGASEDELYHAEENYKAAREKLAESLMKDSRNGGIDLTDPTLDASFVEAAEQFRSDYKEMKSIGKSLGLGSRDADFSTVKQLKGLSSTAKRNARNTQNSQAYRAAKKDSDYAKK